MWERVKERVRGNYAGSEKEGKKDGSGTEDRDMIIVNKIFIKEFYSKRGFYVWNFIVTFQAVPANSNWRLGSWFEILEISCIDGAVWKFRISVVKTFGTGFDICEVWIIDILGAGESGRIFGGSLLIPTIQGRRWRLGTFLACIN